jgi:hypothetical protein
VERERPERERELEERGARRIVSGRGPLVRGEWECELQTVVTGGRVRWVDNLRVDDKWALARLGQWHRERQRQDDARGQVNEVRYGYRQPTGNHGIIFITATVTVAIHTENFIG